MVTKKELLKRIEALEEDKMRLYKALSSIVRRVNKLSKAEDNKEDEKSKITDWLTDDRVDGAQPFLHKGVK